MHSYTLVGTRHIVISKLEVQFGKENYQHLTGIELIDEKGLN